MIRRENFRESKLEDDRLASVGCSDMDGTKKAYEREAQMGRSGGTGIGEHIDHTDEENL